MKRLFSTLFIAVSITSCASNLPSNQLDASNTDLPKNIIMIVGDGMGPAYTAAYRYYHDNPATEIIEDTVFDRHLVGMSSTYPASVSGYVTDSAAGATALSSGVKSYNGAIGIDVNKKPVQTVLEWAKSQGKKTGVVVTSQINHATPAGYLAHNDSRKHYNAIADSYVDEKINGQFKMDVILGGGWKYFLRDDRNLVNEFKQAGFQYLDSYNQLNNIKANQPVIGLFSDVGLPWALDDTNPHRLSMMTKAAVKQLENKNGFFMLIEGSQIDWGGHGNDIAAAMGEMDDLAKTLEFLEQYVKSHPDTLVVLTADHSTGGLTVAANGIYKWDPTVLHSMKHSPNTIAKALVTEDITASSTQKWFNFTLTDDEIAQLNQIKHDPAHALNAQDSKGNPYADKKASNVKKALYKAIKHLIDVRTNTGWTSSGHTAVDVPVFAFGAQSEKFKGLEDNTDIAKNIFKLLGKK
jgi:alkaline phosphatase